QRLHLTVPAEWLPARSISGRRRASHVPLERHPGAVVNYEFHTSVPDDGPAHVALWSEQRVFGRWGAVTSSGVMRRRTGRTPRAGAEYLRYDTAWSYSSERTLITYMAGDVVAATLPWTSAVRLGGVSVARNFRIRPDIVTFPVPEFAGQASLPTAVDVFINGSHGVSTSVPPGPFVISDIPIVNGSGTATI